MEIYKNITIIIKTFEREKALVNLLNSIEKYYKNNIKVIIADDSKKTYKNDILNKFKNLDIDYYNLEFDIGLSKGRNFLLEKVKSKYFLLCDDDFEFTEKTNLEKAYQVIEENSYDIVGGSIENMIFPNCLINILKMIQKPYRIMNYITQKGEILNYNGKIQIKENNIYISKEQETKKEEFYETDIVMNFFLGNTQRIKEIKGWQPEFLKVGEHEIFFIRAKQQGIKVGFLKNFIVKHYPVLKLTYYKYRNRRDELMKLGCKELNLSIIMEK